MNAPPAIVVDLETLPIQQRPNAPPEPVGVAIQWPDMREPKYFAWGHPAGDNCSNWLAHAEVGAVWNAGLPVVFHNSKFDVSVAFERLGLPWLKWERCHDTMFLAYLCDPHAPKLGLKELAEDWLQEPPTERDELHDWIWDHRQQLEQAYPQYGKVSKKHLGAWIFAAPGDLVGRYACGDVRRTKGLYEKLWPIVERNGMLPAYDRERQLMPILAENERLGMRVDSSALERDIRGFDIDMDYVEAWLRDRLRNIDLNFDADADVAQALIRSGVVLEPSFTLTKTGKLSTSKEYLTPDLFTDSQVASVLGYRNRLATCLHTFMAPWLEQASQWGGKIGTNWNQVRGEGGGTRTGRPSTNSHNFLNPSKDFENDRDDGFAHPAFLGVAQLPLVRKYILPDDGHVFLHRDIDGQEMRILAHFEQGDLWRKYNETPTLKPHRYIGAQMSEVAGREIAYTKAKSMNFLSIYGGGIPALQKKLRVTVDEARQMQAYHNKVLPGRKILNEEITAIFRRHDPIRTLGGRVYYCEPPGFSKKHNKYMSYEYKGINVEIQGSAADFTKQTMIDWYPGRGQSRLMVSLYDDFNISAPIDTAVRDMAWLKEIIERPGRLGLSVPILSDSKHGPTWGDAKRCPPEKGCPLCV